MNSIFQTFFKDLITCTNIYIFYFYKYSYLFSAFEGTLSSSNKILYSHFYFLSFNLKFWSYISSIIILKWGERKEKFFFSLFKWFYNLQGQGVHIQGAKSSERTSQIQEFYHDSTFYNRRHYLYLYLFVFFFRFTVRFDFTCFH